MEESVQHHREYRLATLSPHHPVRIDFEQGFTAHRGDRARPIPDTWAETHSQTARPGAHDGRFDAHFGQSRSRLQRPAPWKRSFAHPTNTDCRSSSRGMNFAIASKRALSIPTHNRGRKGHPQRESEDTTKQPGRKDRLSSPKVESRGRPSSLRVHSRHRSNPLANRAESAATVPPRGRFPSVFCLWARQRPD